MTKTNGAMGGILIQQLKCEMKGTAGEEKDKQYVGGEICERR
jgi:hypothetical protein